MQVTKCSTNCLTHNFTNNFIVLASHQEYLRFVQRQMQMTLLPNLNTSSAAVSLIVWKKALDCLCIYKREMFGVSVYEHEGCWQVEDAMRLARGRCQTEDLT
ncbi:unnamed protein product [Brassica rapa subsp. trilocularis]